MADINITLTILDAQVLRALKILDIYPIPQDENGVDMYTEKEWLKIIITRYLKSLVQHVERQEGEQQARDAVSDDEIAI